MESHKPVKIKYAEFLVKTVVDVVIIFSFQEKCQRELQRSKQKIEKRVSKRNRERELGREQTWYQTIS